jgi:signal transduction histidine kinase
MNDEAIPQMLASMPWRARRETVSRVMAAIIRDGLDRENEQLLGLLIEDPKWEVRKEVAEHLIGLGDDHIARFAARLVADSNHFVAAAARRALDRHRKGMQEQFRHRRGILEVQDLYASIERFHGPLAAEKTRRLAERLYDITVGATVHEMRGIITPLVDWVASLCAQTEAGAVDLAYARKHLPRMHDRLQTLQHVVEDMREFSRTTPPERNTESLHELVAEAMALTQDWFAAATVDTAMIGITVEVPDNLLLEVSRHQIVVVLRNVIKNAIESFARDALHLVAGTVSITARQEDELAIIRITDTGMGLTKEELDDVRKFIPGKTSKKHHGTGFGLPIAWRKLRDHGGSLTIESQPEGGTTIILVIPVQAEISREDQV